MSRTTLLFTVGLIAAACAQTTHPPQPVDPFASQFIDAAAVDDDAEVGAPPAARALASRGPAPTVADELPSVLGLPASALDLANDATFAAWIANPRTEVELMIAAWARHPGIVAARAAHRAVVHQYDQARYLEDTVSRYRTFTRTLHGRLGPPAGAGSKRAQAMSTPGPSVTSLRQELATLAAKSAWQVLRHEILDRTADVLDAIAAVRLATRLETIATEHIALLDDLDPVVRRRVSTGSGNQADILRVRAAIADQHREQRVRAAERAHATTLLRTALACDADTAITLADPRTWTAPLDPLSLARIAEQHAPMPRRASIRHARQRIAIRLAERMTTPQVDFGSARVERGMTGEAGAARTAMLTPNRPRVDATRSHYAPATALIDEMRRGLESAAAGVEAAGRDTTAKLSAARMRAIDARERETVHEKQLTPLARQAYDSLRGAYAGRRASFLDVIRSAEERLRVAGGFARARHDATRARAALLRAVGHGASIGIATLRDGSNGEKR